MKDGADLTMMSRRQFVKRSAAGLAAAGVAGPYVITSSALGAGDTPAASERIGIGLIGCGNINNGHMRAFLAENDARVVAVCDPFVQRRQAYKNVIDGTYGDTGCREYGDFRDLLDYPAVDAVCIGVPDHWHAAISIAAMKAGRDVYCEKPLARRITEGRRVVETAAAYGRILQTGLQRRSHGRYRLACELVRNGRIGELHTVKVGIVGINDDIQAGRIFPVVMPPADFDYDMWLGPASVSPYCHQRVNHGTPIYWYYINDYSNGFISGNGVHFVDIAQWGIGDHVKPVEVKATHAVIPPDGLIDDIIEWRSEILYANGVRLSFSNRDNPHPSGIRFEGTAGWLHIDGGGRITAEPAALIESRLGPGEIHLYTSPGPHRNLLDCMRSRMPTAAPPEVGHHATTTCDLVDLSARVGRSITWDAAAERCVGDDQANRLLSCAYRAPWRLT